eukprot:2448481-Pleurochrysis_carterae.AAC.2
MTTQRLLPLRVVIRELRYTSFHHVQQGHHACLIRGRRAVGTHRLIVERRVGHLWTANMAMRGQGVSQAAEFVVNRRKLDRTTGLCVLDSARSKH